MTTSQKMHQMFRNRMWSHGLEWRPKISLSGKGNDYVTRVTNPNVVNGYGNYYQFEWVEDPTTEYLMEHEQKALALFKMK